MKINLRFQFLHHNNNYLIIAFRQTILAGVLTEIPIYQRAVNSHSYDKSNMAGSTYFLGMISKVYPGRPS